MISSQGPTPGSGASISTKRLTRSGCCGGKGEADHVADVVGDQVGLARLQRVQDARDVLGLILLVVAAGGLRREAHAAKVGHDHRVIRDKLGGQRRPHVAGLAEAVQQHDCRAIAADPHVKRRAVGGDLLGVKGGRERHDWGGRLATAREETDEPGREDGRRDAMRRRSPGAPSRGGGGAVCGPAGQREQGRAEPECHQAPATEHDGSRSLQASLRSDLYGFALHEDSPGPGTASIYALPRSEVPGAERRCAVKECRAADVAGQQLSLVALGGVPSRGAS